jgi:hypothetical protein
MKSSEAIVVSMSVFTQARRKRVYIKFFLVEKAVRVSRYIRSTLDIKKQTPSSDSLQNTDHPLHPLRTGRSQMADIKKGSRGEPDNFSKKAHPRKPFEKRKT